MKTGTEFLLLLNGKLYLSARQGTDEVILCFDAITGKETPVPLLSGIETALAGVFENLRAGLIPNVEDPPGQIAVGEAVAAVSEFVPSSNTTVGNEVRVIAVRGVL